jgi:membrane associated rhomboid family serine protease
MPIAVLALIAVNAVIYLAQNSFGWEVMAPYALWPLGDAFAPWQLLTHAFMHGSPMHIVFNMWGLFLFGGILESRWGAVPFIAFYLVAVLGGAVSQLMFAAWTGDVTPMVGASGGVFGLLLAFAVLFPEQRLFLIFVPVPIPARIFAALYAAVELALGLTGTWTGVAHFAHLGGMAAAWGALRITRGRWL